jgi:hypothetical protein
VLRTVRYTGGLDEQRARKQGVYAITSLSADQARPAERPPNRGGMHYEE